MKLNFIFLTDISVRRQMYSCFPFMDYNNFSPHFLRPVGRKKCGRGPQAASGLPTFALNNVIAILYSHVLLRDMLKNVLAAVQNSTAPIPNAL